MTLKEQIFVVDDWIASVLGLDAHTCCRNGKASECAQKSHITVPAHPLISSFSGMCIRSLESRHLFSRCRIVFFGIEIRNIFIGSLFVFYTTSKFGF